MTTLINLYGGPSIGKSILASDIFSELKKRRKNAEMVSEFVKEEVWRGVKFSKFDQFYFFGSQVKKESQLFGGVDFVVTDSPVPLNAFYGYLEDRFSYPNTFKNMAKSYLDTQKFIGVKNINLFLKREHEFQPEGRIHNEQESIDIDIKLKFFLESLYIEFEEISTKDLTTKQIVDKILSA